MSKEIPIQPSDDARATAIAVAADLFCAGQLAGTADEEREAAAEKIGHLAYLIIKTANEGKPPEMRGGHDPKK